MEDLFSNVSNESATPADSGVEASAVSTDGNGAGESAVPNAPVTQAEATAQPEAESTDGVDVGWSLDGEEEESAAIPEADDDLEELSKDPALDQEKVPGLVQAIKQARAEARNLSKEVAQFKRVDAEFADFGGLDGAKQTLGLVRSVLSNQPVEFLQNLYDAAYPAYENLIKEVVKADPNFAIKQLQDLGQLPAEFDAPAAGDVDDAILSTIPQHLQETYRKQPQAARDELDLMSEAARNHFIERENKLDQLDATQRQQAEQQWKTQVETAQNAGREAVQTLSTQYETAHYRELGKWQPFGPDAKEDNEQMYGSVVEGAFAEILKDKQFAQMYQDAQELLVNAPIRRLAGDKLAADADERKARHYAAQFNTKLGQILSARVKKLDSVFKDARAYRELQRNNSTGRTEISGNSLQASNGGPSRLTSDGKLNPAYIDGLASLLPD